MSRFEQEFALVPTGARVLAFLVGMAFVWLGPMVLDGKFPHPILWVWFLVTAVSGLLLIPFVLLVGYVWGDAGRRGMNRLLWVLLAIFIPNAIGIILYFILREPILVPCPACGTPAAKDQAFCARCGTAVRRSCPHCRQPVAPGWTHCGRCGALLGEGPRAGV